MKNVFRDRNRRPQPVRMLCILFLFLVVGMVSALCCISANVNPFLHPALLAGFCLVEGLLIAVLTAITIGRK